MIRLANGHIDGVWSGGIVCADVVARNSIRGYLEIRVYVTTAEQIRIRDSCRCVPLETDEQVKTAGRQCGTIQSICGSRARPEFISRKIVVRVKQRDGSIG